MLNPANGERLQMFPKGELDQYIQSKSITKLGVIPFNPSVSLSCEAGIPIVEAHPQGVEALAFKDIADKIATQLFEKKDFASPTV